jgi:integrase
MATRKHSGTIRTHRATDGRASYTATVRVAGKASASKTFPTLKEAQTWADATYQLLRNDQRMTAVRQDVGQLTVGDVLLEWLKEPETQAQRSYSGTEQMASWFIQHIGTVKVLDVNVLVLREARDKLAIGRSPYTVNRYLIVMRSAWNWARHSGLIPEERRWPERLSLPQPQGRVRFLSDAELEALKAAARAHSTLMHSAIMLSLATGMRAGELLRLDWSDVDLGRALMKIHLTKTDQPRQIHITSAAVEALKALQGGKVRSIHGAVFTHDGARLKESTLQARWNTVRKAAGLKNFRWHDLRHTCASILAQNHATLHEIAEVLGHKALVTTSRYAHLTEGATLPAHTALDAKLTQKHEPPRG